ncbi:DUF4259 domain-containing protein [Pseudomonas sp. TE3610]
MPGLSEESLDEWIASRPGKPDAALLKKAQAAIDRVLAADSELSELWQESAEYGDWREGLLQIREALGR